MANTNYFANKLNTVRHQIEVTSDRIIQGKRMIIL